MKQYGYEQCNYELVCMLANIVTNGITLDDGQKRAVRVAYLQVCCTVHNPSNQSIC